MKDQPVNIAPEKITLAYHRQHPEISLERYLRSKMLATADLTNFPRRLVYLCPKFQAALIAKMGLTVDGFDLEPMAICFNPL